MYLQSLTLYCFKNYADARLEFSPWVNCFSGRNGSGKTNILDAIHYLCLTRSWFNPVDSQNVKMGEEVMRIQGLFDREGVGEEVSVALKRNARKAVKCNGKEYERMGDHIGRYPMVMIVPADINLIYEGSEVRRRMVDMAISQADRLYLHDLLEYNRALEQRNRQLRHFADGQPFNRELLAIWEKTLVEKGERIFEARQHYVEQLHSSLPSLYRQLSSGTDEVSISYLSTLAEGSLPQQLDDALAKDLALQRTTVGVHKDDIQFLLDGQPLRRFGSQGQQKSYIIALKLVEYRYLLQHLHCNPLLLLDDIFEKIDDHRANALLQLISAGDFGQLFITDTSAERLRQVFALHTNRVKFFGIAEGKAIPLPE